MSGEKETELEWADRVNRELAERLRLAKEQIKKLARHEEEACDLRRENGDLRAVILDLVRETPPATNGLSKAWLEANKLKEKWEAKRNGVPRRKEEVVIGVELEPVRRVR